MTKETVIPISQSESSRGSKDDVTASSAREQNTNCSAAATRTANKPSGKLVLTPSQLPTTFNKTDARVDQSPPQQKPKKTTIVVRIAPSS